MAEGHEERRRDMVVEITRTFQLLRTVLVQLPIPITISVAMDVETDAVDVMWHRIRQLIRDEPIAEEAMADLDLAILMFLGAFDVSHIAYHAEDIHWRDDGTYALLAQCMGYLAEVTRALREDQA